MIRLVFPFRDLSRNALFAWVLIVLGCASRSPRPSSPAAVAPHVDAATIVLADGGAIDATVITATPAVVASRCFDELPVRAATACPADVPATAPALTSIAQVLQPEARSSARRSRGVQPFHPRPLSAMELQALDEQAAWICFAERQPQAPEALLRERYTRAFFYYRTGRFDFAAVLLRNIALGDSNAPDPEGLRFFAADLYLDSLNIMGTQDPWSRSPACFVAIGDDAARLRARFCAAPVPTQREDFCGRMLALTCQIEARRAEEHVEAGDFARAGAAYLSLARAQECQQHGHRPLDVLLHNAANAFDHAGMDEEARRARELLVRMVPPARSPLAREARERLSPPRDAGAGR